jgi:deoxycytidine triphosphate deaminase
MPTLDEIVSSPGFLTDKQIRAAINAGHLIERGTWDEEMVRHASYTLRLGSEVRVARSAHSTAERLRQFTIERIDASRSILKINPGDTALLYSIENLRIPDSILAFTVARGLLFAEALTPENTYVDPGFSGPLYTTVTNVSNRIIQLEYGMKVARIFFYKLPEGVETPYRSGAALGIEQQLESLRAIQVGSAEECRRASRSELLGAVRQMPLAGIHVAELFRRFEEFGAVVCLGAFVWPVLLTIVNTSGWVRANLGLIAGNVVAGLVGTLIIYGLGRIWSLLRKE